MNDANLSCSVLRCVKGDQQSNLNRKKEGKMVYVVAYLEFTNIWAAHFLKQELIFLYDKKVSRTVTQQKAG